MLQFGIYWFGIYCFTGVRQPPIWWCHQLVAHPSETVRLPWQVHERGTVYRQLSAQPPHRLLPLKKNLNHFCLDCHSVCDNVYCLLTMFSALAAVCTVYCAIEIVLVTLHYITLRVDCCIWYTEEEPGRAGSLPSPLLTVPNVTAQPVYQSPHCCIMVRCSAVLMWVLKS